MAAVQLSASVKPLLYSCCSNLSWRRQTNVTGGGISFQFRPGHERRSTRLQAKRDADSERSVSYGRDWYKQTRELSQPRTVREELERRRKANLEANNGRERKDLYTDAWDGDKYKGSRFNILTLLALLFVLTPVAGLAFAYFTYGTLWG
ncbi:hypothetical protein WJX72_001994 [[Myrmecia] bisecta]|uniref:Uncharacterized protein n=1 Tax=[Myrmecia] bisecta TaxID=41462 RepID=A0AAW1PAQ7_9CHLO